MNGKWTEWSLWSQCSTGCGEGMGKRTRFRTCSNPYPANGGSQCAGDNTESMTCRTQCASKKNITLFNSNMNIVCNK